MNGLKKAVFLDMQGTLGGNGVDDISNFEFYPFSIEAIKKLNDNGIPAIIITNQSNISRGYLSKKDFDNKLSILQGNLAEQGAYFDGVYCCPHTKEDNCTCKKPLTEMVEKAAKEHYIDLKSSFVVGDMGNSDIILSKRIGAKGILVLTGVGKGSMEEFRDTWRDYEADYIAENVLQAVNWILDYC
ncbi:HAD-IIIA family hydrolase [Clostridium sp. C2-6-12]|uniref:D-glycero-alpha-D-manno-heptose-1,7-bisphosphate 7-phosphatase n=1 Tax=Clostridium sp. C2-6-12 TaxID=2698832 RepID=UPI001371CEC7|nr:HAD-IIIA family hydrolase [Clostridium sp. C2-6-12]